MHHLNAAIYGNGSKTSRNGARATIAAPRRCTSSPSAGIASDLAEKSPPSYDPSSMYSHTNYLLPTLEQLRSTVIMLNKGRGDIVRVEPAHRLLDHVRTYLPPARPYYDQFSITIMKPFMADKRRKCGSCWSVFLHGKATRCSSQCLVCHTNDHHGAECPIVYATVSWWKEQGTSPKIRLQRRPNASELAYLLVAGVFLYRPTMSYQEPLVVNLEHPLVRKFYGSVVPEVLLPDWMEDFSRKTLAARPVSRMQRSVNNPSQPASPDLTGVVCAALEPSAKTVSPSLTTTDSRSQEAVDRKFADDFSRMQKEDAEDKATKALRNARRERKIRAREQRKKKVDEERNAAISKAHEELVIARQGLEKAQKNVEEKERVLQELKSVAED